MRDGRLRHAGRFGRQRSGFAAAKRGCGPGTPGLLATHQSPASTSTFRIGSPRVGSGQAGRAGAITITSTITSPRTGNPQSGA
jgi:hypothetical protein